MNKIHALRLALVSGLTVAGGSAMATVPAAVDTALTGMATDGATVAGLVLVAVIAIVALKFIRKAF